MDGVKASKLMDGWNCKDSSKTETSNVAMDDDVTDDDGDVAIDGDVTDDDDVAVDER